MAKRPWEPEETIEEYDARWLRYRAACLENITPEFIQSLKDGIALEIQRANEYEKIYTTPTGDVQNKWQYKSGCLIPSLSIDEGWREKPDGTREEVIYYGGEWGWLSLDERFDVRQKYPRTAP